MLKSEFNLHCDDALNVDQLMWIDLLDAMLSLESFDLKKGDLQYVFSNAIAKMISSNRCYWITKDVEIHLEKEGYGLNDDIPTKKLFYGNRSGRNTTFEHVVPVGVISKYLWKNRKIGQSKANIEKCIRGCGGVTIMSKEDDNKLEKAGLSRKMPESWVDFDDDPFIRYQVAGLERPQNRIRSVGPICR